MEYDKPIAGMAFGQEIEGFYILKEANPRTTAAGKPFLSAVLADRSGSVDAIAWDYPGPLCGADAGRIVKVRGKVSEFKGAAQLNIIALRPAERDDRYDLSLLVPTAPIDPEAELQKVRELVGSIEDGDYRKLAQTMLERHLDAFKSIPAAKSVHHSFLSGLLMHTANMLKAADFLAGLYAEVIDRSLLLTGTLLHDFAKQEEFSFSSLGLVTDYSVKGQLLGHLVMGAQEAAETAKELGVPEEKSLLLQHLILSHHGEPEFGAAVRPVCAEAEMLAAIDMLDSRMEIYAETLAEIPVGAFSGRVFALDKKIYRHH
jgi:3'-5' exoribonuclease